MIRVDYRGVLFFRLNWPDSHFYPVAAFITVSMVEQNTPGFQASQSYLLIQQLLIFSGITKQDVCQFSPHIFVLEVANLREARKQEKDGKIFFTPTAKKNSIKYVYSKPKKQRMLVVRTFSRRPVWSSPSVLCLGRTCSTGSATSREKRQKRTNNNLVYLWIRGGNASNPRGFESSTAEDWLKKNCFRFTQEQGKRPNKKWTRLEVKRTWNSAKAAVNLQLQRVTVLNDEKWADSTQGFTHPLILGQRVVDHQILLAFGLAGVGDVLQRQQNVRNWCCCRHDPTMWHDFLLPCKRLQSGLNLLLSAQSVSSPFIIYWEMNNLAHK